MLSNEEVRQLNVMIEEMKEHREAMEKLHGMMESINDTLELQSQSLEDLLNEHPHIR